MQRFLGSSEKVCVYLHRLMLVQEITLTATRDAGGSSSLAIPLLRCARNRFPFLRGSHLVLSEAPPWPVAVNHGRIPGRIGIAGEGAGALFLSQGATAASGMAVDGYPRAGARRALTL